MPHVGMICFFDPDTYPGVYNSCNILAEDGWRVDVVCLRTAEFESRAFDPRVRLHRIDSTGGRPGGGARFLRLLRTARRVGRENRWDAAIGHNMHGLVAARLCGVLPPSRIAFWSQDLAEPEVLSLPQKMVHFLKKKSLPDCPIVIAPSQSRAGALKKYFRLAVEPEIVYNAPRLAAAAPDERWRARLGIPQDVPVVAYAGGIGRDRCVFELVESVAIWAPPARLVLAGYGRPTVLAELQAAIARSPAADRIHWVGNLPSALGLIGEADAGVSLLAPGQRRNRRFCGMASNKIFECLAMGVPVLVSGNEETERFFERRPCGVCIRSGSPAGIAEAVNRLLASDGLLKAMSARAVEAHRQETNFDLRFGRLLPKFRELAGGRPSRSAMRDDAPSCARRLDSRAT